MVFVCVHSSLWEKCNNGKHVMWCLKTIWSWKHQTDLRKDSNTHSRTESIIGKISGSETEQSKSQNNLPSKHLLDPHEKHHEVDDMKETDQTKISINPWSGHKCERGALLLQQRIVGEHLSCHKGRPFVFCITGDKMCRCSCQAIFLIIPHFICELDKMSSLFLTAARVLARLILDQTASR